MKTIDDSEYSNTGQPSAEDNRRIRQSDEENPCSDIFYY